MIFIPLILLAFGYKYGKFNKKLTKYIITIPLLIILVFGIPQLIRVENRFNDGNFGERVIEGNDITLTWAAQGENFPLDGTNWLNAKCTDGWRLPTRDEIVRSMSSKPDKETPLWNPHSQIIYYWTSESKDQKTAYLVAYNGKILERRKTSGANYQGFRCVK